MTENSEIPLYDGMAAAADRYDAFILDVWGVLHDGVTLYPGVVDTLERLSQVMMDASICGLGQAAPNPILTLFKYFPEDVPR